MNNFDMSSTGLNISASVFYDKAMGSSFHENNFIAIDGRTDGMNKYYLFLDECTLSDSFTVTITDTRVKFIKQAIETNHLDSFIDSFNEYDLKDLIELLEKKFSKLDLYHFCLNNFIRIEEVYKTIFVKGYNNETAYVLVNTTEFKKDNGIAFFEKSFEQKFKDVLFNRPLSVQVIVNDEPYNPDEIDGDYLQYSFSVRQRIIDWCIYTFENDDSLIKSDRVFLTQEFEKAIPYFAD